MRVFRMRGTINKCWGLIIWGAGYADGWGSLFLANGRFFIGFYCFCSSSRLVFSLFFLFLVSVWIEHRRSACLSGGYNSSRARQPGCFAENTMSEKKANDCN